MPEPIIVVVSQSRSRLPAQQETEDALVAGLLRQPGVDVSVVPNLYDLAPGGSGIRHLAGIAGEMIVCSWLYPRAARWILDRNGIHGLVGKTLPRADDRGKEESGSDNRPVTREDRHEGQLLADRRGASSRRIHYLDLRCHNTAEPYLSEIRRIAGSALAAAGRADQRDSTCQDDVAKTPDQPTTVDEEPRHRWYPVIDYDRCVNCLECIDFCLFGVFGFDGDERILVECPDNCRTGCPACSRICPERAIMFPQHEASAIAGGEVDADASTVDLAQLFRPLDVVEIALGERDRHVPTPGQQGMPPSPPTETNRANDVDDLAHDDLDDLIDSVDELDP